MTRWQTFEVESKSKTSCARPPGRGRPGLPGRRLFAGEVVYRYRILEQGIVTSHHRDSALGHEVALAIGLSVISDRCAFRNVHVTINDGLANAAMPSHIHMGEENATLHFAIGVHAHVGRYHAALHN